MNIKIYGKSIPIGKIVCLLLYKSIAQYLPISYKLEVIQPVLLSNITSKRNVGKK